MTGATLTQIAPNGMQLAGQLDFGSVVDLQKLGSSWLQTIDSIDLAKVSRCNSAGLALLLEWQGLAKKTGRYLSYINAPHELLTAAEVYGVKELLQQV